MKPIRNSAKAVIVEEGRLLMVKCQFDRDKPEYTYLLPGGGQEKGEPLADTLRREVREELGCDVAVGEFAMLREFIDPQSIWGDMHQVEFYFYCKRLTDIDLAKATEPDAEQVDVVWVDLDKLHALTVFPSVLKERFTPDGLLAGSIYVGKC